MTKKETFPATFENKENILDMFKAASEANNIDIQIFKLRSELEKLPEGEASEKAKSILRQLEFLDDALAAKDTRGAAITALRIGMMAIDLGLKI